jgi:hypothetical protein
MDCFPAGRRKCTTHPLRTLHGGRMNCKGRLAERAGQEFKLWSPPRAKTVQGHLLTSPQQMVA